MQSCCTCEKKIARIIPKYIMKRIKCIGVKKVFEKIWLLAAVYGKIRLQFSSSWWWTIYILHQNEYVIARQKKIIRINFNHVPCDKRQSLHYRRENFKRTTCIQRRFICRREIEKKKLTRYLKVMKAHRVVLDKIVCVCTGIPLLRH